MLRFGEDLFLVVENLADAQPRFEPAPGEGMLSFHVRLCGEYLTSLGRVQQFRVQGPNLGVTMQPRGIVLPLWFPAAPRSVAITVSCSPDVLMRRVYSSPGQTPARLRSLFDVEPTELANTQLPVSAPLLDAARSLVECKLQGPLRLAYFESKVYELLCLAMEACERLDDSQVERFSESDLKRFQRAREILSSRFNPPPTIGGLARELGINQTKLKSGFKALFGQTIFEFGHDCRMRRALELLRANRLRVGQVSEAVGYQHQGTFASAFKLHFGMRPKDARRPPQVSRSG
jgi:AraC-like DNA-binding protein